MEGVKSSFLLLTMKARFLLITVLLLGISGIAVAQDGSIVAWGYNYYGQCDVPEPNSDFVAVAAGYQHSLGLKADGSIVAWGYNYYGQCDVPEPNSDFVAVAGGWDHSLGLKADGSIVGWGLNYIGQCDPPDPNSGFVAVAAGGDHSLGLKEDSTLVGWGDNTYWQCVCPNSYPHLAIAAGHEHSMSIVYGTYYPNPIWAWGNNYYGQCDVPEPNMDFIAVAGGYIHSLGLYSFGYIQVWGEWSWGLPEPNEDFVGIAAGRGLSLGLKEDGSIVAWGTNNYGQCNVPEPNSGFVAVAAGEYHSLGLKYIAVPTEDYCSPVPGSLSIGSVIPNPVFSCAVISFQSAGAEPVVLEVYDLSGRLVETLAEGEMAAGEHSVLLDGSGLSPGVYLIRLQSGSDVATARIVLIR